jgi:hypothetical protein
MTGHTERRKIQREVRVVNLTAVTAERRRALGAKEDDNKKGKPLLFQEVPLRRQR